MPETNKKKLYRCYFNKHSGHPWSVDNGNQTSEVHVIQFIVGKGCSSVSRYNGQPANEDSPVAWIEVSANQMRIARGIAYFVGNDEWPN